MPLPTDINTKEYFEIEDFIKKQTAKVQKLEWQAYINRNQQKLQQYWQTWHGRKLSSTELFTLASGSDDPLGTMQKFKDDRAIYVQRLKKYQKDPTKLQETRTKLQKLDTKRTTYSKTAGKSLTQLMDEYNKINLYQAGKSAVVQALGYNIPLGQVGG